MVLLVNVVGIVMYSTIVVSISVARWCVKSRSRPMATLLRGPRIPPQPPLAQYIVFLMVRIEAA